MPDQILGWSGSILTTTPARWRSLVESAPLDLLLAQPAPGEWCALECLQHLVDTERLSMGVRLRALLDETSFPGFNPGQDGSKQTPTIGLAAEFEELRQKNLALFGQVSEADLAKEALHAEYGMVTMSQFLHHWAAHDLMHTVQAERALMQPFIQGCGPWLENYTDHIARTG